MPNYLQQVTDSIETMFSESTLLAAHEGKFGPFVSWLERLGLKKFLEKYPLRQLVEWGWVVPQYRIIFPKHFFDNWEYYPSSYIEIPTELENYAVLWDYLWKPDDESVPLWYLDPISRPDKEISQLLRKNAFRVDKKDLPESFEHMRGRTITPYADYFFRWQGYALVDVIRWADNIQPIFSTPDVVKRAEGIVRIAQFISSETSTNPERILTTPNRWGGLATPMTWLDHFRSFRSVCLSDHRKNDDEKHNIYRKGAKLLAQYFKITPESLADFIKNKLLVLAQEWIRLNEKFERRSVWTKQAWPYLQEDIQLAISWLMILTNQPFEKYIADWRPLFMGSRSWATLDEALPYEFIKHQEKFILLAPEYLEPFNKICNDQIRFDKETLPEIVYRLYKTNYPFSGFLAAFYELHEHLSYKSLDKYGLDFREVRPLDYYALLAIHAEGCLRRKLELLGLLDGIKEEKQTLSQYIQILAKNQQISEKVIGCFCGNIDLTKLYTNRVDPIGRIKSIRTNLSQIEHILVQAFLCCVLARNYFAHHDFLNHELIRSEKSEFLIRGILLTILILLES